MCWCHKLPSICRTSTCGGLSRALETWRARRTVPPLPCGERRSAGLDVFHSSKRAGRASSKSVRYRHGFQHVYFQDFSADCGLLCEFLAIVFFFVCFYQGSGNFVEFVRHFSQHSRPACACLSDGFSLSAGENRKCVQLYHAAASECSTFSVGLSISDFLVYFAYGQE